MKVFLFCLPILSFVSSVVYFWVLRFWEQERLVRYRRAIAIIICVSFVLQGLLVAENKVINFICAGIWGMEMFFWFFSWINVLYGPKKQTAWCTICSITLFLYNFNYNLLINSIQVFYIDLTIAIFPH